MGHAGEVFFKIGMLWQSPDDGHTKEDSQKFARYGKGRRVGQQWKIPKVGILWHSLDGRHAKAHHYSWHVMAQYRSLIVGML